MGHSSDKRQPSRASHGAWLVNVADDVVAPMTTLEVIDALRTGRLSEESLVWRNGMRDWTAVLEVPQLRLAAGSSRPPAPITPPPAAAPPRPVARAPVAPARPAAAASSIHAQAAEPSHDLESTEYVDSLAHFEPVERADPEDSEPVTTLMHEPTQAMMLSSLAPTTAEAASSTRAPGAWGDLDELLSSERRTEQQHTRRIVIWAALGSAAMAAVFTLFLVRSPTRAESDSTEAAQQPSSAAAQSVEAGPAAAATAEAAVPASASADKLAPAPPAPAQKWSTPRSVRRPKQPASINPGGDTASDAPSAAPAPGPSAAPTVTVLPAASIDPATTASAAPSTATPGPDSR